MGERREDCLAVRVQADAQRRHIFTRARSIDNTRNRTSAQRSPRMSLVRGNLVELDTLGHALASVSSSRPYIIHTCHTSLASLPRVDSTRIANLFPHRWPGSGRCWEAGFSSGTQAGFQVFDLGRLCRSPAIVDNAVPARWKPVPASWPTVSCLSGRDRPRLISCLGLAVVQGKCLWAVNHP